MGDHDKPRGLLSVLLADGAQGDAVAGEDTGDGGEHAGAIINLHVHVVAGLHRAKLRDGQVSVGVLPRGAAAVHDVAGRTHDIAQYCRRRRVAARAVAVEHQRAGGLRLDEDSVVGLANRGQRVVLGYQRRVHAGVDGLLPSLRVREALTDGQQLDGVPGLVRGLDIGRGHLGNALAVDVVEGQAGVKAQGGQDGGLGGGVVALHVRGRVGLRVAQTGCFCQRILVGRAGGFHGVQDEVGGAVDDSGDALDLVTSQGAAQHAHHGDGSGHRGLEVQVHPGPVRCLREFLRVGGHQRLVGGDHGFTCVQRSEHELAREVDAADDLHHEVDVIAQDERLGVVRKQLLRHPWAQLVLIVDSHAANLRGSADAVREGVSVFPQQAEDLCAHGAESEQCDSYGLALELSGAFRRHGFLTSCVLLVRYSPSLYRTSCLFLRGEAREARDRHHLTAKAE